MILTILIFALVLGLIVLVHEFGHFITAKKFGMRVEEFGIGFPPKIFGWRKGETLYTLNLIPVGGFVRIKGEDGSADSERDSFSGRHIWQRLVVLAAGVTMNVLLAMLLLSIGFGVGMPTVINEDTKAPHVSNEKVQIVNIGESSPATEAGLESGDEITAIDGQAVTSIEEIEAYNKSRLGQSVEITFRRDDATLTTNLTLADVDQSGVGKMGVSLVKTGVVRYLWYEAIWLGITNTFGFLWAIIVAFATLIKNIFVGQPVGSDVTGPIGIAVLTGEVARLGVIYLLQFTALLSLNLAIINFIPFPALDGGRALFVIIEKIRGKKINHAVESIIHNVGFTLLMLLIALVTVRDITKFSGNIFGFFKNIFS